jgi:hypothetical protein
MIEIYPVPDCLHWQREGVRIADIKLQQECLPPKIRRPEFHAGQFDYW